MPLPYANLKYVSLQTNVQSTQEIVELILDSNRNSLLALDLKVRDAYQSIAANMTI
jgi:magnesium transporter